jgi:hypothetical protein
VGTEIFDAESFGCCLHDLGGQQSIDCEEVLVLPKLSAKGAA